MTINGKQVVKKHSAKVKQHMNAKAADDPLSNLGYGIVAYVNILYTMFWTFLGFSVLLLPTIQAFKSGVAYADDAHVGYANSMISNLGYSAVECRNIPVSVGKLAITCPYGTVGKIFEIGVNNPDSGSPVDSCVVNDQNKQCKPDTGHYRSMFNKAVGKSRYNVNFKYSDLYWREMPKMC